MATAALTRMVARIRETLANRTAVANPLLTSLRRDPNQIMVAAGLTPDFWQAELLLSDSRQTLLNCSRQAGKSTVTAALALLAALLQSPALVLLLSPSLRQSGELFLKVLDLYRALGRPIPSLRPRDNTLKLELVNGSRIISLPGSEATVRCFSAVRLLVVDEAARVSDDLIRAVKPMLAVSGGRLLALSTPFGRRGWFYDAWQRGQGWKRVRIKASQCPRIPADFLAQERKDLGERWYAQEYETEFNDMAGAVFSGADIDALFAVPFPAIRFPE